MYALTVNPCYLNAHHFSVNMYTQNVSIMLKRVHHTHNIARFTFSEPTYYMESSRNCLITKHLIVTCMFCLFQTHLFFSNPELNRDTPTWFFDNMPREDAESILTCGRKFGNVLMRPSSTFHTTQKYVISMRREVAG